MYGKKNGNGGDTKSGVRGQIVKTAHGRDDSSLKLNDSQSKFGKKMGGSTTNLSHSLTGTSAVQNVKGD